MTTKRKALTGFTFMTDDELLAQGATTHQAMSGNPNFPNPVPDITDLKTAHDDYQERLGFVRQRGGFYESSLKRDSRKVLETTLKQLAFHVNIVADGNLSVILSSGFPLSSAVTETFAPDVVSGQKLKDGRQSGYMRLDFKKVPNTLLYVYEVAHERDSEGELIWGPRFNTTSTINNIITPVIPGVVYYVRVKALNGKGVSDWSDPVSMMAR